MNSTNLYQCRQKDVEAPQRLYGLHPGSELRLPPGGLHQLEGSAAGCGTVEEPGPPHCPLPGSAQKGHSGRGDRSGLNGKNNSEDSLDWNLRTEKFILTLKHPNFHLLSTRKKNKQQDVLIQAKFKATVSLIIQILLR